MQTRTFLQRVLLEAEQGSREDARRVTAAVLQALRDRITPDESDQAAAQLPGPLKDLWLSGEQPGRRPLKMHRDEFYRRVMDAGQVASMKEARTVTRAVFAALKEQLSPGEADDILAQLPRDLKAVWEEA